MYRMLSVFVLLCLYGLTGVQAAEQKALRMIIVQNRQLAEDILRQLQHGTSFSALARAYSVGPERQNWGYSGVVNLQDVQAALRPTLRTLKEGQISDILETNSQFIILKVISPQIEQAYAEATRATDANQIPQAIRALQTALQFEVDNVQTYIRIGLLYGSTKQFDEGIRYLEKAQAYAPHEPQIAMLLGALCTHAATETKSRIQAQKALDAYQQALQMNPRLAPSVHFGMGKVYLLALQQPDTAIKHLEQAAQATPQVADVYRVLIQAYYDTRRYDKAWEYMRLAQSLGYNFPDLLSALQQAKQSR
jgi:tetratricopeptide (TPR) repeat protein